MSTITIIVGNIGTVLETTDTREASDIYRHYCDASDRGEGRMARENVTMLSDGAPVLEHVGYDARLESMDDGAFMPSSITDKTSWYVIDHRDGIDYLEVSLVGDLPGLANMGDTINFLDDCTEEDRETIWAAIACYVTTPSGIATINDIERIEGYGSRLSAPGYMDCTEYTVHDTEHDAIVYLVDTYENNG